MGTAFSNDASATSVGTIDSTGSVNTTAGQAIISYTGTGSGGTIAHGLDTAPELDNVKNLDDGTKNYNVYATTLGGNYLELNTTGASGVKVILITRHQLIQSLVLAQQDRQMQVVMIS